MTFPSCPTFDLARNSISALLTVFQCFHSWLQREQGNAEQTKQKNNSLNFLRLSKGAWFKSS